MAKEEECRQCTKCKVGSYGALKCSFYGRLPEFNDSSCPKFTQSNAPIEVKKKEEITKTEVKESVKPDQVEVKVEVKEKKKKLKTTISGVLFLLLVCCIIITITAVSMTKHTIGIDTSGAIVTIPLLMIPIIYVAYIFVFYKIRKSLISCKELLQPFYYQYLKKNTGGITDRVFLFYSIFAVVMTIRCIFVFDGFYHYNRIAESEWINTLGIIAAVFLVLFVLNMIFLTVRLFQRKAMFFAFSVLVCAVIFSILQFLPIIAVEASSRFLLAVGLGIFVVVTIFGADILVEEALKFSDKQKKVQES